MGISERLRFDFWSRLSNALLTFGPTVGIYIVATMLTDAFFMADTLDYVNSIESYLRADYSNFWEFGHLFWRPLGLILFKLVHPLSADFAGPDQQANIYWTLLALNWSPACAASSR